MASHTAGTRLPGGYLGVDTFFALSGFLITSLLVEEHRRTGSVSLRRFWSRRARRLLPALFVLLTAIGVGAAVLPAVFSSPGLRSDAIATVFYVANWHLIAEHANYFVASGQPSPLLHTWSLAIEEQFYLLWPLVVLGVLRVRPRRHASASAEDRLRARRRRLVLLLILCIAGAAASAAWMAVISGNPAETVRNYYGSDTRAQALLVGAALAIAFALRPPAAHRRGAHLPLSGAAVGAAAVLGALWVFVPDTSSLAFHGGFLLAALATSVVIAAAVRAPRGPIPALLELRPVRYLGGISYGMYLWYWPTVLLLTPTRAHLTGYALLGVRLVVVSAVASISAYAVELPIRRGAFRAWRWPAVAPVAAGISVVTIFAATVVPGAAGAVSTAQAGPSAVSAAGARGGARELAADGRSAAPAGGRLKVLLLGDSMAGSLGVGLSEVAPAYGVSVANEGDPGCSLAMDKASLFLWYTAQPGPPCQPGNPQAPFDTWRTWVNGWNPDVVLYLARGEVLDQQIGDSTAWTHIGQPAFDARLAARFREAVDVLGSRGAHVVLLGSPLYDSAVQSTQSDQSAGTTSPWQEDDPARVAQDDALMRSAVSGVANASFIDLAPWLSPGGRYTSDVGSLTARCTDGVHLTQAGGQWVAKRLLPLLLPGARLHHSASSGGTWPEATFPSGTPAWYTKLTC